MIRVEELQPCDVLCHAQYGLVSYSPDKYQVDCYNQEDLEKITVVTIVGHKVKVDPNECFEVDQKAKIFYWSKLAELAIDFLSRRKQVCPYCLEEQEAELGSI